MSTRLRALSHLFTARLSRRIVLWVFASIVIIEAIILIPSVYRRERELLLHLKELSMAWANGLIGDMNLSEKSDGEIIIDVQRLVQNPRIVGVSLYRDSGELISNFGESPQLPPSSVEGNENASQLDRSTYRYDAAWSIPVMEGDYTLIVRHDASSVRQELVAFVGRIAGLVLIISVFVTVATMVVLEPLLITPVLMLRRDLLRAGKATRNDEPMPEFYSGSICRRDELGDVIVAFNQMFNQVTEAITERKQVEESLRQSEQRFRNLVEQAADAFFIINCDGEIVDVNHQACEWLGYSRQELIGLKVQEIQKALTPEQIREIYQKADSGIPVTSVGIHQRKDGTSFPVEVRTTSFDWGGDRLRLSLARDITERKQAEKALERLAEIGELAAMIVHEVRNPLTTVLMGLNSFKSLELPERAHARLELALEEGDRLQRLLSEILLYAKRQTLQTTDINLGKFLSDVLDTLCGMPTSVGLKLEFCKPSDPVIITGDRDKLKQVFINLFENACDASPPGNAVTCRTLCEPTHHHVSIQIHNDGEPIPAEILPKLTKPFFTTKSSGNGLGLAIVKRIVESHGGRLTIESALEQGTTISVVLPISKSASTSDI
ncbi:MAG: PAS domain S-box protein [Elainellaceae cyanobacterium]